MSHMGVTVEKYVQTIQIEDLDQTAPLGPWPSLFTKTKTLDHKYNLYEGDQKLCGK